MHTFQPGVLLRGRYLLQNHREAGQCSWAAAYGTIRREFKFVAMATYSVIFYDTLLLFQ